MSGSFAEFTDAQNFTRVRYQIPPAHSRAKLNLDIHFARCTEAPLPFRAECVRQARRLARAAGTQPIVVHLSGGIDSEIVARSFLEAGLPFTACSFAYRSGNEHDLAWARDFCRRHAIEQRVIEVDDGKFLAEEALAQMHSLSVNEPFPAFEIKRFQLSEGFVVMGNGDPHLTCNNAGEIALVDYYGDLVIQRWQAERALPGCPKFFRASPEILLSFLTDPGVVCWTENCAELKLAELGWWKYYVYKKHWPDLLARPKATGYEKFAAAYLAADRHLEETFCYSDFASRVPYAQLVSALAWNPSA